MKKMITVLFTSFLFVTINYGQFTSVQNGAFGHPGTWSTDPNATAIPDSNSSVVINHVISGSGSCRDLTINENGKIHSGEYFTIYGNLNNNGEIRDDPNHGSDYLSVSIYGNIINNGLYSTGNTYFKGSGEHHLQSSNDNPISFGIAGNNNATSVFIVDNVAYISGTLMLEGAKLLLPGVSDTLVLFNNGLVDGGVIECNNNVIIGKGSNGTIGFNGSNTFNPQQTYVKDAILEGYINLNGTSGDSTIGTTSFIGNIVNNGTLVNAGTNSSIFVEGNITNNGRIESVGTHPDHGIKLEFKNGNLINNGVLKNRIVFHSSHNFTNNSDSIGVQLIGGIDSNTTVSVVGNLIFNTKIIGDYVFNYDASINMNGGKIILPNNGKLINFGMDNTVLNANNSVLENAEKLRIRTSTIADAKIKYIKTSNPTVFLGDLEIIEDGIFQGNATLNCNIVNNGTMSAYSDTTTGDIINNGTWNSGHRLVGNIINTGIIKPSVWEISGNITNKGSWEKCYAILLNGKEDQLINMPTDSTIHSNSIKFDAMLDGTNYQWTRNGVDIAGENGNLLTLLTDLLPDNATYNCKVNGATSRNIIIQSLTDVDNEKDVKITQLPIEFSLSQNYPNPFNPSTVIDFALPTNSNVSLKVFNSLGEEVATLINNEMIAGYHSVNFNATNLSSGIYFYRISAGSFTQTKKMLLLK